MDEHRFTLDLNIFPPGTWTEIAQAIVDQGRDQVGVRSVNALLANDGKLTVILSCNSHNWLRGVGFEAALRHWLVAH